MSNQQTTVDGFQVPPGMMLVPAPQQSQTFQTVTQYQPPTMTYNNSMKNNKVAPPPADQNTQIFNHSFPNNCIEFVI